MNRSLFFFLVICIATLQPLAAQETITVEDIWQQYKFYPKTVPGFEFLQNGKHYTRLVDGKVKQYDITTGEFVRDIFDAAAVNGQEGFGRQFDSYSFSGDEQKLLIKTETESIYRHSTRANFFVFDLGNKKLTPVFEEGKQRYATFSPAADKVAFVHGNNMYYKDLVTREVVQITRDGEYNSIINGATDWVYEEEFSFAKAFEWSPDGKKIAFLRFDESRVKEFTMSMHLDEAYPRYVTFKYPKVGEDNAVVSVHIYDLAAKKLVKAQTGEETDIYFPRIKWTPDPNRLIIFRMNRHQNHLELLATSASTGKTTLLLEEKSKYYIDIHDNLTFLEDGKHFIWTSEKSGFNHIYLYDMEGKEVTQLTKGDYDVTEFYGVDDTNELVFYQAAKASPMQREVYAVNLKGKKEKNLSPQKGWNSGDFSSTFDYFVHRHATANDAPSYTVRDRQGKEVRVIEDNNNVAQLKETCNWQPVEFFSFETSEKVQLNGWMIKPPNFDERRKHPVLMFVYGGPGSQTVEDDWDSFNRWWYQMLAQKGYVVVSVDNRGTGARGEEFKKMTYLELGKYETIDQIEAARYLAGLPFVDPARIGIWGWSYGGYMSSLCILKGNDVFKTAIAVAPVTNWKWYDTIYTERYMRTDKENPDGYKDNSPVYFADRLKGNYLIVHGAADDNVHFQNTSEMVNALVAANKQFDLFYYPNRNHGIYGGPTRLHLYNMMTEFLMENL